jgi:hypothetical protein
LLIALCLVRVKPKQFLHHGRDPHDHLERARQGKPRLARTASRARAQLCDQRVGPLRVLQQHGHEALRAFQLLFRLERYPAQVHQTAAHGGGPEVVAQRRAETPPFVNFDLRGKPTAEKRRVHRDGRRALLGAPSVRFGGAVHVQIEPRHSIVLVSVVSF